MTAIEKTIADEGYTRTYQIVRVHNAYDRFRYGSTLSDTQKEKDKIAYRIIV